MGSLQEQLLKAGLVDEKQQQQSKPKQRSAGKPSAPKKKNRSGATKSAQQAKAGAKAGNKRQQNDLEAAYRARARAEKKEREERKARQVAEQEQRRLRNVQLSALVEGKTLNDEAAEIPRYFNYMNKIRRILLTEAQLQAVNQGEMGIAVLRSRPILLDIETLATFKQMAPDLVPDLGGDEPSGADWDEQYKGFEVPDDLRW